MTLRYQALPSVDAYGDIFKVTPPEGPGERHVKPRKTGFMVRAVPAPPAPTAPTAEEGPAHDAAPPNDAQVRDTLAAAATAKSVEAEPHTTGAAPLVRELVAAQWGLVPHWVKSASDGRLRAPKLVNAYCDTVSTGTAFRDAWLNGQRCIVPMQSFYEDDWRSGKAVPTRISRVDGAPMGVAGIWALWTGPGGDEPVLSFALLTVNANAHALLNRYGQPGSDKRMPVILAEGAHSAWLTTPAAKAKEFLRAYPAQSLTANPVETKADKVPKGWMG